MHLLTFHSPLLRLADVNVERGLHRPKDIQQPRRSGDHHNSVQD